MTGIVDLQTLLARMEPTLESEYYVFVFLADGCYGDKSELKPIGSFQESEGMTLVVTQIRADAAGLVYEGLFRRITLQVHSDLNAIGLTSAVSTALSNHGISANVIAAYHHDHIFVPTESAQRALDALVALSNQNRTK